MPTSCLNSSQGFLLTGGNTFVVSAGDSFFVPLFSVDDSPPAVGNFPPTQSAVSAYFFGADQLGGKNFEIVVDGESTQVGPAYVAGPVTTPPLLDGGGTHLIQLGVFLTPLRAGRHVITIRGEVGGPALLAAYGFSCLEEDYTYTVNVVARRATIVEPTITPVPISVPDIEEVYCAGRADGTAELSDYFVEPRASRRKYACLPCTRVPLPLLLAAGLCVHPTPGP